MKLAPLTTALTRRIRASDFDPPRRGDWVTNLIRGPERPFVPFDSLGRPMSRVPSGRASDYDPPITTFPQYLVGIANGDTYSATLAAPPSLKKVPNAALSQAVGEMLSRIVELRVAAGAQSRQLRASGMPKALRAVRRQKPQARVSIQSAMASNEPLERTRYQFASVDTGQAPDPRGYLSQLHFLRDTLSYLERRHVLFAAELHRRAIPTSLRTID